jgi:hypothetical protein
VEVGSDLRLGRLGGLLTIGEDKGEEEEPECIGGNQAEIVAEQRRVFGQAAVQSRVVGQRPVVREVVALKGNNL